ncbi:MAG: hypothetical protein AAFX99_37350, partial [Myxococcota bacterium]
SVGSSTADIGLINVEHRYYGDAGGRGSAAAENLVVDDSALCCLWGIDTLRGGTGSRRVRLYVERPSPIRGADEHVEHRYKSMKAPEASAQERIIAVDMEDELSECFINLSSRAWFPGMNESFEFGEGQPDGIEVRRSVHVETKLTGGMHGPVGLG